MDSPDTHGCDCTIEQRRSSISSIARLFPRLSKAFDIISKTTELFGALHERPYFFQVMQPYSGISLVLYSAIKSLLFVYQIKIPHFNRRNYSEEKLVQKLIFYKNAQF